MNSSFNSPFYTPFDILAERIPAKKKSFKQTIIEIAEKRQTAGTHSIQERSEEEMFQAAMRDVKPLEREQEFRIPPPKPTFAHPKYFHMSELEAYAHLTSLVEGSSTFDLYYTDEYVEGCVQGLSDEIIKKLRKGFFSYQDYLDLHGYNRKEAYEKVLGFLENAYRRGQRCVLIVTGRGLNSENKKPVLKESLVEWLTQGALKHIVLAFSSARAHDGGLGAFYVLLKKFRKKGRFYVATRHP